MSPRLTLLLLLLAAAVLPLHAEKPIRVFIALCDNKTQGIIPVGAKIGDGDKPEENLYWGCSDGFGAWFRHSKNWKVVEATRDVSPAIMRRLELRHTSASGLTLIADAYRGSEMKQCLLDFQDAVASGDYALVAYIGHNGLMDADLPTPTAKPGARSDAIVLCCLSQSYFADRLRTLGSRPVLLTSQLMYPGAFLLDAALETWRTGGTRPAIREAAARAYAKNQRIGLKPALGVFAPLAE